jgi:phospholipid N-methyltransferase
VLDAALDLGVEDHPLTDTILYNPKNPEEMKIEEFRLNDRITHLHRATSAEKLALGEELALEAFVGGQAGTSDERGLSNVVKHRVQDLLLG